MLDGWIKVRCEGIPEIVRVEDLKNVNDIDLRGHIYNKADGKFYNLRELFVLKISNSSESIFVKEFGAPNPLGYKQIFYEDIVELESPKTNDCTRWVVINKQHNAVVNNVSYEKALETAKNYSSHHTDERVYLCEIKEVVETKVTKNTTVTPLQPK